MFQNKAFILIYLRPDGDIAKDDLEAVKEVVAEEDDTGPATRPALTRTERLDAGGGGEWR